MLGGFVTFMMHKVSRPIGELIPKIDIGVFHKGWVGDAAWTAAQGGAGMADQQGEVALPQRPRRVRVAGLQQSEPVCDGTPG